MSLTGKIRTVRSSRSGYGSYTYYSSYQRSRRERIPFSRTHHNFILFCFAFATTNEMREDLFWQWVQYGHLFTDDQKRTILELRTRDNENMHSLGFLDLSGSLTLRSIFASALGSLTNNIGDFLNSSLEWARTPQGHDFWMQLNRRFGRCWSCITRGTINSSSLELGIPEFRGVMAANISARVIGRDELMNSFFFNYDEMRRLRREERDRQLREARETVQRELERARLEQNVRVDVAEMEGAEMEYNQQDTAVNTSGRLSQEEINRAYEALRDWTNMHSAARSRFDDIASPIESVRAPVDHEVVFPEVTTAANTATSPVAEQGTTPIAGQGTQSHAERRISWSFIDPFGFGLSGGTDNH